MKSSDYFALATEQGRIAYDLQSAKDDLAFYERLKSAADRIARLTEAEAISAEQRDSAWAAYLEAARQEQLERNQ